VAATAHRPALWRGVVLALCLGLLVMALAAPAWAANDDLDLVGRAARAAGAKGNGRSARLSGAERARETGDGARASREDETTIAEEGGTNR
jgi:hypothetical protein